MRSKLDRGFWQFQCCCGRGPYHWDSGLSALFLAPIDTALSRIFDFECVAVACVQYTAYSLLMTRVVCERHMPLCHDGLTVLTRRELCLAMRQHLTAALLPAVRHEIGTSGRIPSNI